MSSLSMDSKVLKGIVKDIVKISDNLQLKSK